MTGRGALTRADGGLVGVRDRLASVDGELTIVTLPGEGTRLRMVIPCV
ncbi:MAG: hypothetical protein WAS07_08515 [Micropruina sp.]